MLVKRNNPLFPALSLFEDIFSDDFDLFSKVSTVPAVNIKETNDAYVIEMAAPGLKKSDFDIEFDNGILTISSKKEDEKVEENVNYTKREFSYSEFKRSFTLPDTAEVDKIEAKYKDGILEIVIPKKEEAKVKPKKKISIK